MVRASSLGALLRRKKALTSTTYLKKGVTFVRRLFYFLKVRAIEASRYNTFMQPILFHLGPLAFYSFGVFITLAFLAGGLVTYRLARASGLVTAAFIDYFLYVAVAGLLGARLWHLLFRPFEVHSVWQVFSLWGGGLSLQGGVVAAGLVLWLALRRSGQPVLRWFDVVAVGLAVGLAIGKVGSFLNGDSFGRLTKLPWGVKFTDPLAPGTIMGVPLHPIQLYAAFLYAVVAVILWRSLRKERIAEPPRSGGVVLRAVLLISAVQFALEFLHAPIDAMYIGTSIRVVSLTAALAIGTSGILLYRRRRAVRP